MSDYIKDLRKLTGHIPLVQATASVIILNSEHSILLQHRTDDKTWGIPGGFVEPGETIDETALREVFEETGLIVGKRELFGIYSGKEIYNKYPNGDEMYFVDAVFITKDVRGGMRVDGLETEELKYFELTKLPSRISPSNVPILRDLQKSLFFI